MSGLLIGLLLILLFRSLSAGLIAMVPNLLPVITGLGLMGWLGISLDASTVMIATIALGVAVDDTVHFMQHYRRSLHAESSPSQAIRETLRLKGPAIVWTSVVITGGFSVLITSKFLATRHFGLLICAAMVVALLGDLLLLPALLARVGAKSPHEHAQRSATSSKRMLSSS
ncbi:MAG: MMPL family transporter [Deltaproteobacteria bacterium]|nr:MMPL family transporter [Deltaproteobacteria bacterium]